MTKLNVRDSNTGKFLEVDVDSPAGSYYTVDAETGKLKLINLTAKSGSFYATDANTGKSKLIDSASLSGNIYTRDDNTGKLVNINLASPSGSIYVTDENTGKLVLVELSKLMVFNSNGGGLSVVGGGGAAVKYLFQDEFTTDLAGGNVNGTACEPGPYNRAVVDDNNKLSIANGKLTFITGGVGFGNPGYWVDHTWNANVFPGLTLSAKVNGSVLVGWDDNKTSTPKYHSFFITGTSLSIYESNGTVNVSVGTALAATDHNLTIIRGINGRVWYFVQGGIYTNTELVWSNVYGTAALYPVIETNGSMASTVEYCRIPETMYVPPAIINDSFNRTNAATLGSTDGLAYGDDTTGGGLAWTARLGAFEIATNKAKASALDAGGMAIATVTTPNANVFWEYCTLARSAGIVGIVLRYVDASNYVYAAHDGTNAILVKRVAGTETTIGTTAKAFGAGKLTAMCSGSTFRVWWNNEVIGGGDLAINDAVLQSSTIHGLYTTDTGNTFDALTAYPRGS